MSLGWRFIIVFYLFIHIILGQSPIKAITKYLGAEDNEIAIIKLYAGTSRISYDDETNLGWKNNDAVIGSPDLPGSADTSDFNDSNSSLYIGGSEKLVLGDFWFLADPEIYIPEEQEAEIEIIPSPPAPLPDGRGETEENISLSTEELIQEEIIASTTVEEVISSSTEDVVATSTEIITTSTAILYLTPSSSPSEGEGGREEDIEIIEEKEDREVEIFEPDWATTTIIEVEVATSSDEDLMTINNWTDFFNTLSYVPQAKAQEFIIDEIASLNELGELKEAKLVMSFALDQVYRRGEFVPFSSEFESETIQIIATSSEEEIATSTQPSPPTPLPDGRGELEENKQASSTDEIFEVEDISSTSIEVINEIDLASSTIDLSSSTATGILNNIFGINEAKAQNQLLEDAKIAIWYSLGEKKEIGAGEDYADEQIWQLLDVLTAKKLSNHLNNGYFEFKADFLTSWEQIENLEIKFEGLLENDQGVVAYVDSFWVEAMYDPETELEKVNKRERWENALELLSNKLDFQIDKGGELSFKYNKSETKVWDTLFEIAGLSNFWQDVDISAWLVDSEGKIIETPLIILFQPDGEFVVNLPNGMRQLKPGTYTIKFHIEDFSNKEKEILDLTQSFVWGVLALNFDQASYLPDEEAYIQMAALNEEGHTICDAELSLIITSPYGNVSRLFTKENSIISSVSCGANNVTDLPDYFARYETAESGLYTVELEARTENGIKNMIDSFIVQDQLPFIIKRFGPTRIYPWADYEMKINIKANENFIGDISETVPNSFRIVDQKLSNNNQGYELINFETEKTMVWQNVRLEAGDEIEIVYKFDAPNISPEFFLLGPLEFHNLYKEDSIPVYKEARSWQIASDAQTAFIVSESIAIDTGTTSTILWEEAVSIASSSFIGGETYFIYVTSGFSGSTISVSTDFEILYDTTAQYTGLVEGPGDAYDANQVSWFDVYTMPATPEDVILQYRANSGASYALNAQIIAINLSEIGASNYAYNENTTNYTHTTAMSARANVILSQADGAKDWLVFGMEEVQGINISRSYEGEIFDGTNSYMLHNREPENALELIPYVIMRSFNDVATNTVYSIRVRDDQAGVNIHDTSRVFALNLDAFESFKTYYADVNTTIASAPSWTEAGNLNSGGNYTPDTSGDQLIFASFINDVGSGSDGTDDRLQVNNTTVPTNWSWVQSPTTNRTSYDATDQILQNIVAKVAIPDTGQAIDLSASAIVGTAQVIDEVSITVFSMKLKSINTPTGTFNAAVQRMDGSGVVDISVDINDGDDDDCRVKIEYILGSDCGGLPDYPTLDTVDINTEATYGDPEIDNNHSYQVGTSGAMILTNTATNTVEFDWLSAADLSSGDTTYCLRLTANDNIYDQSPVATTTLTIDNVAPSSPGPLGYVDRTGTTTTLSLNSTTTETNFLDYIIYYKIYDGSNPDELDTQWASSSDLNLDHILFNTATTTKITGLIASTTYSFAIWAYDQYGNKASSSRIEVTTNDAPTAIFNQADTKQRIDGSGIVDISIEVDDNNNQDTVKARIEFATGTTCLFAGPGDPTIDINNVTADFNPPTIDNDNAYQIGTTSGWIKTSPGSNTVTFDWLTKTAMPNADDSYCLQIIVNDRFDDQLVPATTTITLDNVNPNSTGNLTVGEVTMDSIALIYATNTPGTDTNEPASDAYQIFRKQGTSGVTVNNIEHHSADLNAYNYSSATSTVVSDLEANTWYVFNIWTHDNFGNRATATEIAVKTNASLSNDSLVFTNPLTLGPNNNIALAGTTTEWNIQAVVSETNGWYAISSTTLRLADNSDNTAPYNDLKFRWNQTTQSFSEVGSDILGAITLSNNSTSTCAINTCTLDFKLVINKNFASSSVDYTAELISDNDSGMIDSDTYPDFYQVRFPYVAQIHYLWRYDDGGE
ncbi:fibronectin type III domain-containing protein [Candidatus Parcubacteria bacterium]|nr:fibronectin type III domain-containing protein [Candidatus Parcubacteria bacterium]